MHKSLFSLLIFLLLFPGMAMLSISQDTASIRKDGKASFYHDKFHGRQTSNGEQYNKNDFTAAHRSLPYNSIVQVVNKKNGKSVIVRINDRGPFTKSRIIDLSRSAAEKIDMVPFGVVPVTIRLLTILDKLQLTDSTFIENDVWDCFGNKLNIQGSEVLVWINDSWKHTFYIATKLALENGLENVAVRVEGPVENRAYEIIIHSLKNQMERDSVVNLMKSVGFKKAIALE